jgi:hypothetical protein
MKPPREIDYWKWMYQTWLHAEAVKEDGPKIIPQNRIEEAYSSRVVPRGCAVYIHKQLPDDGWNAVRAALHGGKPLAAVELAVFVRRSPIPDDLREHIADALAGIVVRRRGRRGPDVEEWSRRAALVYRVVRWRRVFDRIRRRTGRSSDPYP